MNGKKVAQIAIPVFMALAVSIIWYTQNNAEPLQSTHDGEFPLTISSVDLEELSTNNMPIIIDFGADECEPCKAMEPVLLKLNDDMQGKAIIQFVDVWKNPSASTGFPVKVIPTQVFVNADGSAYVPSDDLGIEFLMYANNDDEHVITMHEGGLTEEQMLLILADMGVEVS